MGSVLMAAVVVATVGVALYLVTAMVHSIRDEKKQSGVKKTWSNFGLSIAFCVLFFLSWLAQGVAEWQVFTDDQRAHEQPVEVGDFVEEFTQSTLENWQSEFLQLFSFVVLSALLIHRGSAESRDSDDRMEEALKRIEEKLGTK
jgi:hypothetical protein